MNNNIFSTLEIILEKAKYKKPGLIISNGPKSIIDIRVFNGRMVASEEFGTVLRF